MELEGLLKKLNPKASIVRSSYGKIDLKMALNTKKFHFDELQEMRGWLQELQGDFDAFGAFRALTCEDPIQNQWLEMDAHRFVMFSRQPHAGDGGVQHLQPGLPVVQAVPS